MSILKSIGSLSLTTNTGKLCVVKIPFILSIVDGEVNIFITPFLWVSECPKNEREKSMRILFKHGLGYSQQWME